MRPPGLQRAIEKPELLNTQAFVINGRGVWSVFHPEDWEWVLSNSLVIFRYSVEPAFLQIPLILVIVPQSI